MDTARIFFLPLHVAAGIRTRISRVASTRDICKDAALQAELLQLRLETYVDIDGSLVVSLIDS